MSSATPSRPIRRSKPPTSTTRRILKVASLGVAGLIAGLLGGCSASLHLFAFDRPTAETTLTASRRVESLETKRIPALRHAPVPHYTHPVPPNTRQAYALRGSGGATMAATRYPATQDNADFLDISEQ